MKKPKRLLAIVATAAVLALIAVIVGYWGATLPMRQLSESIID